MNLPTLDSLHDDQWNVYDHPIDKGLFVAGPPGSGKTSLAVLRAEFLVKQQQSVIVLTRNRMLAALVRHLSEGKVPSKTMHAFISQHHYRHFAVAPPQPTKSFHYNWVDINLRYQNLGISPSYNHIIVDEGQNLPPLFFEWAKRFGGQFLTVFADEHQASCDLTSSLADIATAGELPDPIRLQHNYRNTPEIAKVAEHFHQAIYLPPAIIRRPSSGEKPKLIFVPTWDGLASLAATRLQNRSESIGIIVYKKDDATYLQKRLATLLGHGSRVEHYRSDMEPGAEAWIKIRKPGITILTGEAVIGLEFECVYLADLHRSLPCATAETRRRLYMLCSRAQSTLFLINGLPTLSSQQIASLPESALLER